MTEQLNSHGLPILPATAKKERQGCPFNFANNRTFEAYAVREYKRFIDEYNDERERKRTEREARQQSRLCGDLPRAEGDQQTSTSSLF